jgi:hypothetical protein
MHPNPVMMATAMTTGLLSDIADACINPWKTMRRPCFMAVATPAPAAAAARTRKAGAGAGWCIPLGFFIVALPPTSGTRAIGAQSHLICLSHRMYDASRFEVASKH